MRNSYASSSHYKYPMIRYNENKNKYYSLQKYQMLFILITI